MTRIKRRLYEILEVADPNDRASYVFGLFLISLITVNIFTLILGTVESIYSRSPLFFNLFELVTVLIFLAEYLLRLWSCTSDPRFSAPIRGRLRFSLSPLAVVDLIAILPTLVTVLASLIFGIQGMDMSYLRAIRLVARVAKMGRYSTGVRTLARVITQKREDLLTVVFVLMVLLLLASSFMYYAERNAQPDKFANIPSAMWWSIITLTTVGYGDVFPVTILGRSIAGVIAILGIGMFALPAGILGSGFLEEINHRRRSTVRICPNCGEEIRSLDPES
jgi:voltage-gated potassium channel